MTSTITDKIYGITSGKAIKVPVKAATTANITLSGQQTIDGVAVVADDRVLVKNQTDQTTNGIYTVSASTWERAADFDGAIDVTEGTLVYVTGGTVNEGVIYKLTTSGTVTFGTSNITFSNTGIGTSAFLSSIGALGTAADKFIYTTGAATAAEADITSLARNLLDDSTTSEMQSTLGGSAIGKTIFTAADEAAVRAAIGSSANYVNDFRLTLTTGTPVTTSDVTGATTIYLTPYKGKAIALYVSGAWQVIESAQVSIALGTLTSGRPYDVFAYSNSGTLTLEILAWTSDTARATSLAYQDGVLVKSGDATRRYVGTFYTSSTTTTEDSVTKRFLYNYYNRVLRPMSATSAITSWTYSTASWRQAANATTSNKLSFVVGVSEDSVRCWLSGITVYNSTSTERQVAAGLGLDEVNADSSSARKDGVASSGFGGHLQAEYNGFPGVGKHYIAWIEYGGGADTQTWYARLVSSGSYSGILGEIMA